MPAVFSFQDSSALAAKMKKSTAGIATGFPRQDHFEDAEAHPRLLRAVGEP